MKWISVVLFFVSFQVHADGILIVGDSISLGYMPYVKEQLPCVIHAPGNDRDTWYVLANMDSWLAGKHYHIIHVNAGLWDVAHRVSKDSWKLGDTSVYPITTDSGDYLVNMIEIIRKAQLHADIVIWATMTDIPQGSIGRDSDDAWGYNIFVPTMIASYGASMDDLYTLMINHPEYHKFSADGNYVHFTSAGYQILANHVVRVLKEHGGC